jgi:2-polyprenyl-3-methyl-5-hydroxy-6-metoxy-1,4-benzoquinol methylase
VVQCEQCGLIYQNPRPTLDEMAAHYPPEYDPYVDVTASHETQSWLYRQAIDYGMTKRGRFVTRHHQAGGRLLDVGCAAGLFLRSMRKFDGWQVEGVEISEYAARIAHEQYGLKVHVGTLEAANFPDQSFAAVTIWDVLEHLHDPAETLAEIYRILEPGGVVVIRVPNMASWFARVFGRYWAGLDAPRHLYFYSPKTLAEALQQAGFQVVDQTSGSGNYPTFVLSVRFWLVAKHASAAVRQRVNRLLLHPIARVLTVPFFYLSGLGLRGPLLVMTARKAPR